MPVITFASSKGGVGKTTSAILLATTLARSKRVILIDADDSRRLVSWAKKAPLPGRLSVVASGGDRTILKEIHRAKLSGDYVVIDLEGAATRRNAIVMGESDLVIIPMGDERPDAEAAIETLADLAEKAKSLQREIPVRILFARTKAAVKSRLARSLNAQVRDKIGAFTTELHERTAFATLHDFGGTLYNMDPTDVTGLAKAIGNTELFVEEVLEAMRWIETIREHGGQEKKGEVSHG